MEHSATRNATRSGTKARRPSRPTLRMTSVSFQPRSVLFDKGVIRRVYERWVRLALGALPTPAQVEAATVYAQLRPPPRRLYITKQPAHILHRRPPLFAAPFLAETYPLQKGRYLRRWARRLRELTFAPEDAI